MPTELELVLRLVLSAVLAGAIGIEREVSDQPAGFRTHMLVGLGACLFTVISAYGFGAFIGEEASPLFRFDPTRIAAQIVTGIGFLGAGAILRYGMSVRGLTTAASLWVVAAIGLAVGVGAYLVSSVTTAITILTLFVLRPLRGWLVRGIKREHEEFVIEAEPDLDVDQLVRELSGAGMRVDRVRLEDDEDQDRRQIVVFLVLPSGRKPEDALTLLSRTRGVRNVDWSR